MPTSVTNSLMPGGMEENMRKKNFGKVLLHKFCISCITLVMMIAIGFVSYKITYSYYMKHDLKTDTKTEEAILNLVNQGEFQEISKNIILGINGSTGQIKYAVLEILNTKNNNLDYITIPTSSQIELSTELYQKLYANNPDVPQIIVPSQLHHLFSEDFIYQYAITAIEDLLGTEINYYTITSEENFRKCFQNVNGDNRLKKWKESYRKKLKKLKDRDSIQTYITEYYEEITSNLTLKRKLEYIEYYEKVNLDFVYFHQLPNIEIDGNDTLEVEETKEMVKTILENSTYQEAQESQEKVLSNDTSVGLQIQILNASKIDGLASQYKQELTEKGYQFITIGNYNGGVLEHTKIYISSEEIGSDLQEFFQIDEVEISNTLNGVQVQIILGLDAKK